MRAAFGAAKLAGVALVILGGCAGELRRVSGGAFTMQCTYGDAERCAEECRAGEGRSCNVLGEMYEEGDHVARDLLVAVSAYSRACAAKVWAGCGNLGRMYAGGRAVPRSEARAIELYMEACAHRDEAACSNLRDDLPYGERGPRDRSDISASLRAKCDRSDAESCTKLGVMYGLGIGVPQDKGRANKHFDRACGAGSAEGCFRQADHMDRGLPAYKPLVDLYAKACAGGYTPACHRLAYIYYFGESRKNEARARELFDRTHREFEDKCSGGEPERCIELGIDYEFGFRLDLDKQRATELFQRACDGGAFRGCVILARNYRLGWCGVTRDPTRAATLLEGACSRGYARACAELADMVGRGEGTPRDSARALDLYKKACRGGDEDGCTRHGRGSSNP